FDTNIHSQNLSEIQKFNYLPTSLKGELLRLIEKFQPNKQNYDKAIKFLTNKCGNSEELIRQLVKTLDGT
ncbi:hypothetical protein Angca_000007, partial [Angiostrongylus cantonensis]